MHKTFKIRKRLLVNKEYQFHFVKIIVVQMLFLCALLVGMSYFFLHSQMEFLTTLSVEKEKCQLLQEWTGSVFVKVIGVVALACIFQCLVAFILSGRTAGPLYRLKRYLNEISKGSAYKPIHFRRYDQFKEVQDAYNEMVTVLEKERQNDLRVIRQMEDGIAQLKRIAKDEQLFQLVDYIERLNSDLKNFKTR